MKRAILVIDMINDFVTGKFENERAKKIIPNIKKIIGAAKSKGVPVIYACDSHQEGDPEFSVWDPHAIAGTKGAEVVPELEPEKDDEILEKTKFSAFFDTGLDEILNELGVESLVLTGVLTEICIQHTAADAFYRDYELTIPEDGVESTSDEENEKALEFIERAYGAEIVEIDDLLEGLED